MGRQRQLSEFLCREMLYDFAVGDLDATRAKAIEVSIKEYPELETEFQSLKQGLSYSQTMSQAQVPSDFLETILLEKSILEKTTDLLKMHKWTTAITGLAFIGALSFGMFFFDIFEKMPQDILWTTDLTKPSDHINQEIKNATNTIKNNNVEDAKESNL